jgi:large subunit ribosomal protein L18
MKLSTKQRKIYRVRNNLKKVSKEGRYRLSVSRSAKNISAQIIDDNKNTTILSSSSKDKTIKALNKKNKTELSTVVAENLAKKALEKNITKIYFDRGLYKYHGRVKIFAEILRKNGMEF